MRDSKFRYYPGTWLRFILLVLFFLSLTAGTGTSAHRVHSSTHRPPLAAFPNVNIDDMDGDGVDEWMFTSPDGTELFVTDSTVLSIGRSYSIPPFARNNSTLKIQAFITGSFLGFQQPRVICAFATATGSSTNSSTSTLYSCAILQPLRFELQWIIDNGTLPFSISNSTADQIQAFVGDFDGDGKDELMTYSSIRGEMKLFVLANISTSSTTNLRFVPKQAGLISIIDAVPSQSQTGIRGAYALTTIGQEVYVANILSCGCGSFGSSSNPVATCARSIESRIQALRRLWAQVDSPWRIPSERVFQEPPPSSTQAPNPQQAAFRAYTLDTSILPLTFPTDDIILLDVNRGVVQVLTSCVQMSGGNVTNRGFFRKIVTQSGFVRQGESLSIATLRVSSFTLSMAAKLLDTDTPATIASIIPSENIVLFNPLSMRLRVFAVSSHTTGTGQFERAEPPPGDIKRLLQRITAQSQLTASTAVQLAWMRLQKPRAIQPSMDSVFTPASAAAFEYNADTCATTGSIPGLYSYYLSDVAVWNPQLSLLHSLVGSYVSSIPSSRISQCGSSSPVFAQTNQDSALRSQVSQTVASVDISSSILSLNAWHGGPAYLFSFSQQPVFLQLDADTDGDAILTRYELGGLDPNRTGNSLEPLMAYNCSPFRKDVLVEVDYMEDNSKSMRPTEGFEMPAIEDFARHSIRLHVFVDQPIPRIADLGAANTFNWDLHFVPLKESYFTPSRRGLFHYSIFIDQFDSSSVSGQSAGVPANDFFVSLGGWTNGHGTLTQQAGTFLHELGHNLNLMHGGDDEVNYKPNHLSVMNYAYQVGGIQEDGKLILMLSNQICDSLNEKDLNEFIGVVCRGDDSARGHNYATHVQGQWHALNQSLDFNANGIVEKDVSYDLNGDSLSVLQGGPNEYERMRFSGLDPLPYIDSLINVNNKRAATNTTRAPSNRELLAVPLAPELSFEQFTQIGAAEVRNASMQIRK